MENQKLGRQTFQPGQPPVIIGFGSAAGNKEGQGPLGRHFDHTCKDDTFGCKTWEQAESAMQGLALDAALKRAGLHTPDLDLLLAGDLLNQCIGSGYAARAADVPFFGLYGACSTMGESLALATLLLSGGYGTYAAAVTSSHFCSAERQYRTPLEYGSQRTPTAQWTATAAGAVVVTASVRPGPRIPRVTIGRVKDKGIKDANNMGAAMAPVEARLGQYIPNRWYDCITRTLSKIAFSVVPTACDILFERIATYARISTGNQAARVLPTLPYLPRISSNLDRRPGYPHKRAPRSFLFFRPLLLRQFSHLISAPRRPDLHHLPRRVDLPGGGAHRRPAAALPPPDAGGAGRPAKPPPDPILHAG